MRMLKLVLLLTVIVLSCFACAAPPKANEEPANRANTAAPSTESKPVETVDVKSLYTAKCVICHGEDGKGVLKGAPNFTDTKWQQQNASDGELAAIIKNGKEKMPAFSGKLEAAQINALVGYVRSFAK